MDWAWRPSSSRRPRLEPLQRRGVGAPQRNPQQQQQVQRQQRQQRNRDPFRHPSIVSAAAIAPAACKTAPGAVPSRPSQNWRRRVIKLNVNGKTVSVDVDPDMPLLWVLREHLQLTGTKFGCGMALCGACTVHLDGEPVRSCATPVSAAVGKKVTTIEAVGRHARRQGRAGRLDRARRAAVRLLPVGPDHERQRAAGDEPEADRRRHRRRDERQHLPLRHLQPDPRRHQGRRGHPAQGGPEHGPPSDVDVRRRTASQPSRVPAAGGGALVIGFHCPR